MKKIGAGWQYNVYDIGNDRVLKKFHPLWRACWIITKDIFPFKEHSIFVIPRYATGMKKKALESFDVLKKVNLDASWIGNPKFVSELDFEQDKVTTLHDYFKSLAESEGQKLIDDFVIFNKKLLEKGVIDKSFNIGKNFGVNNEREIILTDIGELFYGDESINKQISIKPWSKNYITDHIPQNLVDYFIAKMDTNFTI